MPKNVIGRADHAATEESPMFRKLNYTEPAVLRGIVTAAVALLAALGFANTDEIEGAAEKFLPVVALLIPVLQALWTRFAVWSPRSHAEAMGKHAAGLRNGPQV